MSTGPQKTTATEVQLVASELLRHLEWLREAGVTEVPTPTATPPTPSQARPAPVQAQPPPVSAGAATGERAAPPTPGVYSLSDRGCGSDGLLSIRRELGDCTRCKLSGGRRNLVFGVGDPKAELMFVGEGPGADEDAQGEPFVGAAGQLLTKMIEAMGFRRDQVYIANVVKCRPPNNRNPEPDEIAACQPFLEAQIAAVKPKVIVALGRFAVQTLLQDTSPISRLRGSWREYQGVKLMPTFHPAYLLRSPAEKRKAWEDLQQVMKECGQPPPGETR